MLAVELVLTRKIDSPEASGEVANAGLEDRVSKEIGSSADELSFEVPTVDATRCRCRGSIGSRHGRGGLNAIPCAGDNVEVMRLLESEGRIWFNRSWRTDG